MAVTGFLISSAVIWLSDITHEILGVKELCLTTQTLVSCLIKRSLIRHAINCVRAIAAAGNAPHMVI